MHGTDQREHGRTIVRAFMQLLPRREYEVISRLYGFAPYEEQTEREVAEKMGIPLVAVRRHHARAEAALRNAEAIKAAKKLVLGEKRPILRGEDRLIERVDMRRGQVA